MDLDLGRLAASVLVALFAGQLVLARAAPRWALAAAAPGVVGFALWQGAAAGGVAAVLVALATAVGTVLRPRRVHEVRVGVVGGDALATAGLAAHPALRVVDPADGATVLVSLDGPPPGVAAVPVVVRAAPPAADVLADWLRRGVAALVDPAAGADEVAAAARVVDGGGLHLPPDALRAVVALRPAIEARNPDGLTPRELEVLALVARGRSNDEIAADLVVGVATVKTHINRIFAKASLRDRAQAVVYAFEHGLAEVPPVGGGGADRDQPSG